MTHKTIQTMLSEYFAIFHALCYMDCRNLNLMLYELRKCCSFSVYCVDIPIAICTYMEEKNPFSFAAHNSDSKEAIKKNNPWKWERSGQNVSEISKWQNIWIHRIYQWSNRVGVRLWSIDAFSPFWNLRIYLPSHCNGKWSRIGWFRNFPFCIWTQCS